MSILCFNYSGRYDNSFFGVSNICAWCQHVLLCYCDFCMYDSSSRITFPLKIFGRSVYEAGDIRDYNCRSLFFFFFCGFFCISITVLNMQVRLFTHKVIHFPIVFYYYYYIMFTLRDVVLFHDTSAIGLEWMLEGAFDRLLITFL